jgi:hypothetical protein
VRTQSLILHTDKADGRVYWLDEQHPDTGMAHVVCRVVEGKKLGHTSVRTRADLKPYLYTEITDGTINMGSYPERLNGTVEAANSKA